MTTEATPAALRLSEGLGPLPDTDWTPGATLCHSPEQMRAYAMRESASLREALTELRDRIKGHPAYADLTEEEEIETGGDTAELSYLARVADAALRA